VTSNGSVAVTVWGEGLEQRRPEVSRIYPRGIHEAVAAALTSELRNAVRLRTATEHGLASEMLEQTDVLVW